MLFRMHRKQLSIPSCAPSLLNFGVPDVCAIFSRYQRIAQSSLVALTVNFARTDQSLVDVCLPTLESHSIVSVPIPAFSGSAEIAAPMSYELQPTPSQENSQELAAAPPLQLVLPVPNELAPLPVTLFVSIRLLCFTFHRGQMDSWDPTNILCSSGLPDRSANKQNVIAWIRCLVLMLTFFLDALAITCPFLAIHHLHRI